MDDSTIQALNTINQRFYETVANDFDATRQQPWQGWQQLVPYLREGMRVLDVGCGNGRFGVFVASQLGGQSFHYTGIDNSDALLERARTALGSAARLELRDVVEAPPDEAFGQYELVVLFGVLHHIPGAARRLDLVRRLARRVAPGGRLVFSEWRFDEVPRLRERIVAWDDGMDVEAGDYLLDWRRGTHALRYCHAVDDAEHARLVEATGLLPVAEFRADSANLYAILEKPLA